MKKGILVGVVLVLISLVWFILNVLPIINEAKTQKQPAQRARAERRIQTCDSYPIGPLLISDDLWAPVKLVTSVPEEPTRVKFFIYNDHTFHHDSDCEACRRGIQ